MEDSSFEHEFLQQIYASQDRLHHALEDTLKNIFNLYDSNGDGKLDVDDFISFISDLLFISVLMRRIAEQDYSLEAVIKFAQWASSNFANNLFNEPQCQISYSIFLDGIMHATTEHKSLPVLSDRFYFVSFVPEILNYFTFYNELAKRRGWPTYDRTDHAAEPVQDVVNAIEQTIDAVNAPEPIAEPVQDVVDSTEPVQDAVNAQETVTEPVIESVIESVTEPVIESVTEPVIESVTEPVIESVTEPVTEPIQDPIERRVLEGTNGSFNQLMDYQQRHRQQYQLRQEQLAREQEEIARQEEERIRQERLVENTRALLQLPEPSTPAPLPSVNDQLIQFDPEPNPVEVPPLDNAGKIEIEPGEQGYDPIEGNVNIVEFVNENPFDNIAFKIGDSFYLARKSRIGMMIHLGEKDNSIFYGCTCEIDGDWTNPFAWSLLPHVVIQDPKYYNIQQLGIPIRYVRLDHILAIMASEDNYFLIDKNEEEVVIPSFASDNVLNHGIGSMSGLHCQAGQNDTVYRIRRFDP